MKQSALMKDQLTKHIKEINPDLIITFGPDGDTGHSDHRMISNMTTEIILKEGWVEKIPVYYLGWTEKDNAKFKVIGGLNTVDPKYLNVSIKYTQEEEEKALDALGCDKSQLSVQEIQEWKDMERKDLTNTLFFRQLTVSTTRKSDF